MPRFLCDVEKTGDEKTLSFMFEKSSTNSPSLPSASNMRFPRSSYDISEVRRAKAESSGYREVALGAKSVGMVRVAFKSLYHI